MIENQPPHYHVFLSHNSRDKGAVEPLAVMLKEKGLNPFLDKWNLVPGEPIEDALIEALEHSDSAVIFVGPGGEGPWQSEEMRDILKRAVKSHNEFRAIPVLLPNASADALEKSFLGSRLWIEFKSVDDDDALLRMAKAIQGEASGDASFTLPDEPAPYRGLERFERIEKPEEDFFFGRDDEIRALVERLVKERFVAVVGASGSGKSSLIRAGLTKQLAEEIHPGIRRWQTITVEPGSAPFRSLAVQIAVAAGIPVADRETWIEKSVEKWRTSPEGLRSSLAALFADAKDPLLLFIDQFEEIFTHRREGKESEAISRNFVAELADIWRNGGDRIRVVVALRADFVDRCLEIGPLKELLQDRTMLVGEVGDDALREIVKEPAARVGAFLEKGLMERILTEVHDQSGSLPLLEQALHGLWRNRKGAWLTHEAYDASGGVARALNDQAQGAYKSLNDEQKKIADSLFPRLITLGEGVADTRRRVKRNELYPEGVEPGAVNAVIDTLSGKDARILVTTREGGTAEDLGSGEDFVEFTHEALLGNWDHLVTLLDSERESIRKHRSLTTAAEEWESKPEDEKEKFLLRAGQLVIAEQWATDEGGYARLNQLERRFLDESIQERTAEEARKAKIARGLKWRSWIATAAAILALVGVCFAVFFMNDAIQSQKVAETERNNAKKSERKAIRQLSLSRAAQSAAILPSRPQASLLLAVAAMNTWRSETGRPTAAAETSFRNAVRNLGGIGLSGQDESVYAVAFSPDNHWVVTGSGDGTARLWDLTAGDPSRNAVELKGHDGSVGAAAFSPDNHWVVTGSSDKTARLWDLTATDPSRNAVELKGHRKWVRAVAFSPDNHWVVTGSSDKTARLWDLRAGHPSQNAVELIGHVGPVNAVAFSPDNHWVVTGSDEDKTARLWDLTASDPSRNAVELIGHVGSVYAVAFSPDNHWVVTGSLDRTARLWDLTATDPSRNPVVLRGHDRTVGALAFSPDNHWVVTGSWDGTARLWDLTAGDPSRNAVELKGHDVVWAVAFNPDNHWVVTGSEDGTARLWDLTAGDSSRNAVELKGHDGPVDAVAFSPDNRWVVTGSTDGTARLWDLTAGDPSRNAVELKGHNNSVWAVAFSPDNHWVVTGSSDKTARLWDLTAGDPSRNAVELKGHRKWVRAVAFSPDNHWVVTGSSDKTARLWDLTARNPSRNAVELKGHDRTVWAAAFSPDNHWVVTGSEDGTARLWDLTARNPSRNAVELKGHERTVRAVAFSPDNHWVVTGSEDGTARLWDLTARDPSRNAVELKGHDGPVDAVAFSPDNHWVVTGSSDKTARLWDLTAGDPSRNAVELKGHISPVNAVAFSPDNHWVVTGSEDGTARLWDLTASDPSRNAVELKGHDGAVESVAFSPDSRWVVTGSGDTTARLWDLTASDPSKNAVELKGHDKPVKAVAFSPDNHWVVTGSTDGTARLWNLRIDELLADARRAVGRNFTQREWEELFPGEPYRKTFEELPEGK